MKNLSVKGYTAEVSYTETVIPVNEFEITGRAQLSLWGGGSGGIEMQRSRFEATEGILTEDTIRHNLNDGGFGAERIISARVFVFQRVEIVRVKKDGEKVVLKEWTQVYGGKHGRVVKP